MDLSNQNQPLWNPNPNQPIATQTPTPKPVHADCPPGFYKKLKTGRCEDIDECETGDYSCPYLSTECRNVAGSYECPCEDGFKKVPNSTECIESFCEFLKCDQGCSYWSGGCFCWNGYKLLDYRRTCVPEENNCHSKSFCDGICEKTDQGEYTCKKCPHGIFWRQNVVIEKEEECFQIAECEERDSCAEQESCVDLKNNEPSKCLDLNCPEDYQMDEDRV